MYTVFYRNYMGEQRIINWFGGYAKYIISGRSDAIAMTRWCFGVVDILAVIKWHQAQEPPSPFTCVA